MREPESVERGRKGNGSHPEATEHISTALKVRAICAPPERNAPKNDFARPQAPALYRSLGEGVDHRRMRALPPLLTRTPPRYLEISV